MGLRTAAAKLGFRLAAASSRLSKLMTRSTTSLAPNTAIPEKKKYLYLCFTEHNKKELLSNNDCIFTNLVIRPIRLDTYNDDHHKEEELRNASAHTYLINLKNIVTVEHCIRLGSKILFAIGEECLREICWVDPSTHPVEFHVSSPTETKIKSFSTDKQHLAWGVVDGKLYCFDNDKLIPILNDHFESLDPETDNATWQPLSRAPFVKTDRIYKSKYNSVLFLDGSKKILGWKDWVRGVFCFDTTKPENGWTSSPPSFGNYIPFSCFNDIERENGRSIPATTLVIHDNHPKLDDFNLVLLHSRYTNPFLVSAFFISDDCDSFQSIHGCIHLPKKLCAKYRVGYFDDGMLLPCSAYDSQFADLGDKKFCLILHKFFREDAQKRTSGIVLVLTFEYDIIVSDEIKIKTRILGTRRFRYGLKKYGNRYTDKHTNRLTGAFSF